MNPWVMLGAVLALIGAAGGGFYYGSDYQKGKAAREEVLIQKAGEAAQLGAATEISKIHVAVAPVRERVIHELQTNTVYKDCLNTPAQMENINQARTGVTP